MQGHTTKNSFCLFDSCAVMSLRPDISGTVVETSNDLLAFRQSTCLSYSSE